MLASHRWLSELSGLDWSADEMARRLTSAGLEIENVRSVGTGLDGIVVAEVRAKEPHPTKSGLTLVTVFDGTESRVIVCGAPNVPEAGHRVVLAKLGAKLPNGLEIAPRKVAGVDSPGMLCGETELDIGSDDAGLFLIPKEIDAALGTPISVALGLDDVILEIGITPNRPDGLGHRGLARELCALASVAADSAADAGHTRSVAYAPKASPTPIITFASGRSDVARIEVILDDSVRSPRYAAARVTGVTVAPSPFALRYRLHRLGIRAISNLVDATNLVMLEWGHPIHAFDAKHLTGADGMARIVVRTAREGESMKTLDSVVRTFDHDDLLICDSEKPVAIGGVMGGELSGIEATTSDVVIECAYFDPRSVRRTARRQGMHTDASHRFERGVDPNAVRDVLQHAASLIGALGEGAVTTEAVDVYPNPIPAKRVALRFDRLRSLLGTDAPRQHAARILESLGVTVVSSSDAGLVCDLPTFRPDLLREVDLIEEVARLYGYERLPTTLPRVRPSVTGTPRRIQFARALKSAAASTGLHEAMCFGFVSPDDLSRYRVPTDAVLVANPMTVDRSVMRTSLLPGLGTAAARALRHGARLVRLFELGSSFHKVVGEALPEERATLAFVLLGEREAWFGAPRSVDFFDAKGHVEAIVHTLTGHRVTFELSDSLDTSAPYLHPKRRAFILLGDRRVGCLGEVHPDVVDAVDLGGRGLYAELDVVALLDAGDAVGTKLASGLPRFPAVTRDLAVLVDEAHPVGSLMDAMRESGAPLLESVELFDEYRGEHVPAGMRSLAFRIVYRDPEATLTDGRVESAHTSVVARVVSRFGAQPR